MPGDVPAIARIYGWAVRESIATFDVTDPPLSYWQQKLASVGSGDHVVVVEDAERWSGTPTRLSSVPGRYAGMKPAIPTSRKTAPTAAAAFCMAVAGRAAEGAESEGTLDMLDSYEC